MLKLTNGQLINKTQFCQSVGATKYQFEQWVREGMPVESHSEAKTGQTMVYLGRCIVWLATRALGTSASDAVDSDRERGMLYRAQREKAELDNRVARGELVPVAEVRGLYATLFSSLRDRVRGATSKIPLLRQLALEDDEVGMAAVLDAALREAFEDVAAASSRPEVDDVAA